MKKIFNNSFEMAYCFFNEIKDSRQWGEVEEFFDTPVHMYYWRDMQDKYVRGHSPLDALYSTEYRKAEFNAMSGMIDFIKNNTSYVFPCEYESVCTYADGRSTYYKITVTPINQISFRDMGLDYSAIKE